MKTHRARHRELLDRVPADERAALLQDARQVHLPGNVPPWTDSGIRLRRGDRVTLLSTGRVFLSKELGLWGGPRFHLWGKVGERGPIFNGTRDTFTFEAPADGALHLAIYQGEWANPEGELATPLEMYQTGAGGIDVLVLHWKTDPCTGLLRLRQLAPEDPRIAAEIERLASPILPPPGWRYLWFLGESEIFASARHDGRPVIAVRADGDVGILQRSVELELTPDVELSWSWKIDALPAREPENTLPTHDYLSIAVEFDDGRDLTWYWSAALPVGTTYACPLPSWTSRETHVVIRSGTAGLGRWRSERRNVFHEYRRALGEPPRRIVAVWLIAVSLFQHRTAEAWFADIALKSAGRSIPLIDGSYVNFGR